MLSSSLFFTIESLEAQDGELKKISINILYQLPDWLNHLCPVNVFKTQPK
jgi:hypothetical protein